MNGYNPSKRDDIDHREYWDVNESMEVSRPYGKPRKVVLEVVGIVAFWLLVLAYAVYAYYTKLRWLW